MAEEKKVHIGVHFLRYEPKNMKLIIEDQIVMEAFRKIGCLGFSEACIARRSGRALRQDFEFKMSSHN